MIYVFLFYLLLFDIDEFDLYLQILRTLDHCYFKDSFRLLSHNSSKIAFLTKNIRFIKYNIVKYALNIVKISTDAKKNIY